MFQSNASHAALHGVSVESCEVGPSASAIDLLDKNALTTAGVVLAAGGAVSGSLVLTAALPVPVIGLTAVSAGLIYAGDRQAKGLPINPFNKDEVKELAAEPTVVAAA